MDPSPTPDTASANSATSRRSIIAGGAGVLAGLVAAHAGPASAAPRSSALPRGSIGLNVKLFGARGDGVSDDTAAIQRAIDSPDGDAACVFFPPGTYRVSGTLYPKADQTILGVFPASIVKAADGVAGFTIFDTRKADGGAVAFEGLVIDVNRSGTTEPPFHQPGSSLAINGAGIHLPAYNVDSVGNRVTDCEIRDGWNYGLVAQRIGTGERLEVAADNVRVHGCGGGLFYYKTTASSVLNCVLEGNERCGMNHYFGVGTSVHGVRAERNESHGICFVYSADFRILGCECNRNGQGDNHFGWGIVAGGSSAITTPNHDFTIANNRCDTNGSGGISLDPTLPGDPKPQVQRASITGNVCSSDGKTGFNGIYLNHAQDVTVVGNVCHGLPYGGINVSYPGHSIVTGNVCFGNKHGIGVESTPQGAEPYGQFTIGPNMCYGNEVDFFIPDYPYQDDIAVLEPRDYLALTASKMGFFGAPAAPQPPDYTVAAADEDRSLDPSTADTGEVATVLATLISDLQSLGLLK